MNDPTDLLNYAAAIKSIESSGNYGARGPSTRNGDRAYGAYQVMGNNIPSWTQKHYGQSLSPQEFLNNKEAQDAVFKGEFGGYVQKHGNPQDAASMWFTGRPLAQGGKSDDGYITGNQYVDRFNKALGQGGGDALSAIQNAAPSGASMPPGALGFAAAGQGGGALSPQAQQSDPASSGVLFAGEQPNKLHSIGAMMANAGAAIAGISNPAQGNSLRGIAQGIEAQAHGKFTYQMGPNGQLLRINKDTNAVDSIAIPDGQKESFKPIMGKDGDGNPTLLGHFNEKTGEYKKIGGDNAPAAPMFGGDPTLQGQERYDSLKPDEQKTIDAWRDGTGIQPTSYTMRQPKIAKLVEAANSIGIDMSKYGARQAMARELTKSTPGSAGGQLDSSAAMIKHVTDLADDYIKLKNTDGYGGTVVNAAKNALTPSGSERDQLLKSIATHSMNFSGEVTKQLSGAPGGQEERQRRVDLINQPRGAPSTQAAALEAELSDAINKRQATLDRVKDTMGEHYMTQPRFQKQEAELQAAKAKLIELRHGPAIKDGPKSGTPAAIPSSWDDAQKAGWK
jgi:hypothetical protein